MQSLIVMFLFDTLIFGYNQFLSFHSFLFAAITRTWIWRAKITIVFRAGFQETLSLTQSLTILIRMTVVVETTLDINPVIIYLMYPLVQVKEKEFQLSLMKTVNIILVHTNFFTN